MEALITLLGVIWAAMNSPVGIAVVAGIILWVLNKLYASKPAWAKYEGAILSGIKFAEKNIPDDTPNKSMAKLDEALRYVLRAFETVNNRRAKPKEVTSLREGVQIKHAELEAAGSMTTVVKTTMILLLAGVFSLTTVGCQAVFVHGGDGPVNISANNSVVATDGQEADSDQNQKPAGDEVKNNDVAD